MPRRFRSGCQFLALFFRGIAESPSCHILFVLGLILVGNARILNRAMPGIRVWVSPTHYCGNVHCMVVDIPVTFPTSLLSS